MLVGAFLSGSAAAAAAAANDPPIVSAGSNDLLLRPCRRSRLPVRLFLRSSEGGGAVILEKWQSMTDLPIMVVGRNINVEGFEG